mmetsp:Transcript_34794/g.98765  ORF Transcript_34794/g.98765 Transcript_34794/m.98765 type:complete len:584 (-) Transcript_34794:223-1974(-)
MPRPSADGGVAPVATTVAAASGDEQRLRERTHGDYQWEVLLRLAPGASAAPAADFAHPGLTLREARRLECSQPLAEGDLLFACRAWALAPGAQLQGQVVDKLQRCTQIEHDRFFCLPGGDASSDGGAIPASLDILGHHAVDEREQSQRGVASRCVDPEAVRPRLRRSALALDRLNEEGAADEAEMIGIWLPAAFLGHSCIPNVSYAFFGDLMVCRAARRLEAGTELCCAYVSSLQPHYLRRAGLQQKFGMACACARCRLEEVVMDRASVHQLLARLDDIVDRLADGEQDLKAACRGLEALASDASRRASEGAAAVQAVVASDAAVRGACLELGLLADTPGKTSAWRENVERLLCASFLPCFKALAFAQQRLGEHRASSSGHGRCVQLLEQVAPASAYHAHWAVEHALESRKVGTAGEDVDQSAHNAQRWVRVHYGLSERMLRALEQRYKWPADLLGTGAVIAPVEVVVSRADVPTQPVAPEKPDVVVSAQGANLHHTLEEMGGSFRLSIQVPDGVDSSDIGLDVGSRRVLASVGGEGSGGGGESGAGLALTVELPREVEVELAPPAKFKRKGRWLILDLPLKA